MLSTVLDTPDRYWGSVFPNRERSLGETLPVLVMERGLGAFPLTQGSQNTSQKQLRFLQGHQRGPLGVGHHDSCGWRDSRETL